MISAVIVAAGKGTRMGEQINKQYIRLQGKEVLAHTLDVFANVEEIDRIIVVTGAEEMDYCRSSILQKYGYDKEIKVVPGGSQRQESVYNGLVSCGNDTDIVLIHDGARPFVSREAIRESIETARRFEACTVAVPVKDTIKLADKDGSIIRTVDREGLYLIQTPQTFRYGLILEAHARALESGSFATDDTLLVEEMGVGVKIVQGDYFNIKLTTPEDLIFGNAILEFMEKERNKAYDSQCPIVGECR